jgi:putative ATP-binding cassette transporter
MKLFSFLLKHSPWLLALAVVTGVMSGVASAALMALINTKLAHIDGALGALAWGFTSLAALVLISNLTSRLLLLRLSTRAVLDIRLHICRQLLLAPLRQVESHGSSPIMAALTEDILAVSDTLAEFPLLCINVSILLACLSYLLWLCWPLGLALLGLFIFGVLSYELIEKRTRPFLKEGREKWDELIGFYQALLSGNKELKLHRERRCAFFSEGLVPTAASMRKLSLGWHTYYAVASAYGQIFYFLVIGAVLFIAPALGHFSPAVLAGFTLLILYVNGPISFIVGAFPSFQRASVSLAKIESVGLSLAGAGRSDVDAEVTDRDSVKEGPFRNIEVVGLQYAYKGDEGDRTFMLGPLDLRFDRGELTFIIGGNGSGKSSFARLLTGLYVPDAGSIRINGVPVTDENRDLYRQRFSTVFSDYFLFDKLFGLVSEDLSNKVSEYLRGLRLSSKVKLIDGRFSTIDLSQGQRKRLALVTAFVEDRDIYLFDEWAADQDPSFKEVFYYEILPELRVKGKTVLVISHDDHYYHVADRIIKFEDGVVVEDRVNLPDAGSRAANAHLVTGGGLR